MDVTKPADLPPIVSPRRVVLAGAFFVWAVTLAVLLVSGGISRYLAPRNTPFVVLAVPVMFVVAFGIWQRSRISHHGDPADEMHELSCMCRWEEAPRRTDLVTTALLLVPLVVLAIIPSGALGSDAARSRGLRSVPVRAPKASTDLDTRDLTILDIVYATTSPSYAKELAIEQGADVRLVGIAVKAGGAPAGGFLLTRFLITCCVADAVPISVRVSGSGAGAVRDNSWVEAQGTITWNPAPQGTDATEVTADLRLERVKAVSEPIDPYLY
jgi:uncharacterized repeat protein (TIGR03943 family)